MNDTFFVGPLIVPVQILMLAVACAAGYAALRYRLHRAGASADERRQALDPLGNAFFVGLLIWKFSPLLLDTRFVLDNPMSLLYFSGGRTGLLLAGASALIALGYRTWKSALPVLLFPDAVLTFLLAGGGVYMLLKAVLQNGGLFSVIAAVVGFSLYYAQLRGRQSLGNRSAGNWMTAALTVGLVLGMVQGFMQEDRDTTLDAANTGIEIGDAAADFTLTSLDGTSVRLSDYRGKKVLLNFWATWCPPCKAEMPHVERFYQEARQQDVVVLGVNLTDTERSADRVGEFVRERQLTFPIVLDATGQVSDLYRVRAYPTSIMIDAQGVIRDIKQGAMSYESMRSAIRGIK